jgi:hypothetical protein
MPKWEKTKYFGQGGKGPSQMAGWVWNFLTIKCCALFCPKNSWDLIGVWASMEMDYLERPNAQAPWLMAGFGWTCLLALIHGLTLPTTLWHFEELLGFCLNPSMACVLVHTSNCHVPICDNRWKLYLTRHIQQLDGQNQVQIQRLLGWLLFFIDSLSQIPLPKISRKTSAFKLSSCAIGWVKPVGGREHSQTISRYWYCHCTTSFGIGI